MAFAYIIFFLALGHISQNFLGRICKIFVILGLKILSLLWLKVVFEAVSYRQKLLLSTVKILKYSFSMNKHSGKASQS